MAKGSVRLGGAAVIMGASVLLSRIIGLFREQVIAFQAGASARTDVYFAAFVVPDFLNYLLAGAYFTITLIPLLNRYWDRNQEEEGWRFFSSLFALLVVIMVVVTALAMLFAHRLPPLVAPKLDPAQHEQLVRFLRIILPAQIFFITGSCLMAVQYARRRFFLPAMAPIFYNLGIVSCGLLLGRRLGMEGFCWGVLVGSFFGNFLIQYFGARRLGLQWYRPNLRHPGLREFMKLALPLMIGQSVVVLDEQFSRIFGSFNQKHISWLNYARRLMMVPVGVVAQAAGVASFPFLSGLFSRGRRKEFHATIAGAIRGTMVVIIPVSVFMIAVARPTVAAIYQHGAFSSPDTIITSQVLMLYLAGVFAWGIQQVVGRAYYARKDTLTPAIIGSVCTIAFFPVYLALTRRFGIYGVAATSVASILTYSFVLSAWWRRSEGAASFDGVLRVSWRSLLASAAGFIPATLAVNIIQKSLRPGLLTSLSALGTAGILFSAVFLPLARLLIPSEINPVLSRIRRRIRR